jgi:prephenate dehydratase
MLKIGYLGPIGTFSNSALEKYLNQNQLEAEGIPAKNFFDLFVMLQNNDCQEIVVPIENSVEGSVNINIDLLVKTENIHIKEEVVIPIKECLLAKEQCSLEMITDIISHPQPIAQCRNFLLDNMPNVTTHSYASTAAAAKMIANGDIKIPDLQERSNIVAGVLGNKELANIYGLKIIKEDIQDAKNNETRFMVLTRSAVNQDTANKTSIVFAAKKDEPGSLFSVLKEFAKNNINLTRITSRPTKEVLGEYLFFIDFEGGSKDQKIIETLELVKETTSYFRVLGSYKKEKG